MKTINQVQLDCSIHMTNLLTGVANDKKVMVTTTLTELRNTLLERMSEKQLSTSALSYTVPLQQAFIGDDIVHHFIVKLGSTVSMFLAADISNGSRMCQIAFSLIEQYMDLIAEQYLINPRTFTATTGEAKAPLVAKSTRKKGKK